MSYATREQCEQLLARTDENSCLQCVFYYMIEQATVNEHGYISVFGECRKNAPVIVPDVSDGARGLFPEVDCDDWCGQHERVETPRTIDDIFMSKELMDQWMQRMQEKCNTSPKP